MDKLVYLCYPLALLLLFWGSKWYGRKQWNEESFSLSQTKAWQGFFAVMILLNSILGIMAKVAPQMNMFAVGIQLKVLVGLCILFLTVGMIPGIADFVYTEMKRTLVMFVESMM